MRCGCTAVGRKRGDFTEQALSPLHAHFFEPYLPAQTSGAPVTTLWSPSVHAAGP